MIKNTHTQRSLRISNNNRSRWILNISTGLIWIEKNRTKQRDRELFSHVILAMTDRLTWRCRAKKTALFLSNFKKKNKCRGSQSTLSGEQKEVHKIRFDSKSVQTNEISRFKIDRSEKQICQKCLSSRIHQFRGNTVYRVFGSSMGESVRIERNYVGSFAFLSLISENTRERCQKQGTRSFWHLLLPNTLYLYAGEQLRDVQFGIHNFTGWSYPRQFRQLLRRRFRCFVKYSTKVSVPCVTNASVIID